MARDFLLPNQCRVLDVLDRECGIRAEQVACLFVSGSLLSGWAHATSDLDIFAVLHRETPVRTQRTHYVPRLKPAEVPVLSAFVDDLRWDVEVWQARQVDDVIDRVGRVSLGASTAPFDLISEDDVDFAHRISIGQPLLAEDWFAARRDRVTESEISLVVATMRLNHAESLVEDAEGQLASGDLHSATLSARSAFGFAVDGLLASHGSFAPNAKWRARKMQDVRPPQLSWEAYWKRETMVGYDSRRPAEWVGSAIEEARQLILSVEVS